MNQYNNEVGVHNPSKTKVLFDLLCKATPTLKWIDSSWHNDMCDSACTTLEDGRTLRLYFPNADVTNWDNEEIADFQVIVQDGRSNDISRNEYSSLDDAVTELVHFATMTEVEKKEFAIKALVEHIIAMENDVYFHGHWEWEFIVADAKRVQTLTTK